MLKGLRQCGDLLAVLPGHLWVQQRRRRVVGCELRFHFLSPGGVRVQLVLDFTGWDALHDGLDELLSLYFDSLDLAVGSREAGAVFHPEPVHPAGELVAELFEQILTQQLVLQRSERARFNLVAPDGEVRRRVQRGSPAMISPRAGVATIATSREPPEGTVRPPSVHRGTGEARRNWRYRHLLRDFGAGART
jgi:hypothetical protein